MTTDYDYECGFYHFGLDEMYREFSLLKHLQVVLNGPYNTQITMDKSGMKCTEANEKLQMTNMPLKHIHLLLISSINLNRRPLSVYE